MGCAVRRKLADYEVGLLPAREAYAVARHLERCPDCQAELAALRATADLLRAEPPTDPPVDLWPAIRSRLTPRSARTRRPSRAWQPALALAMVLLLVVAAVWVLPALQHQALPLAPAGDGDTVAQVQLAAAWEAPLADQAALGLAMLATLDEDRPLEVAN